MRTKAIQYLIFFDFDVFNTVFCFTLFSVIFYLKSYVIQVHSKYVLQYILIKIMI